MRDVRALAPNFRGRLVVTVVTVPFFVPSSPREFTVELRKVKERGFAVKLEAYVEMSVTLYHMKET